MQCSRAIAVLSALGLITGCSVRIVLVTTLIAAPSFAGFVKVWRLEELAQAPVLAVCRVERVTAGADVPAGNMRWRTSTREMRAVLTVLRSLPILSKNTLIVSYYSYGKVHGGLSQSDALWPRLSVGDTRVFPLVHVSGQWRLAMEEGRNNIMPAIAPPRPEAPSKTRYDFLVGELVNALCWGRYRDLYETALYLRESEWGLVPGSLMPLLRQNIASDWQRWADIAACSLANLGTPRRTLAEIRAAVPPRSLATFALRQLSERGYPELVIRRMIHHSDLHEWGSAATLQEFAKHPLVLRLMPARLRGPAPGAVYVTSWIIWADAQSPLVADALGASFNALRNPSCTYNDRYAATNLILEKASETQFAALLDQFRATQQNDPKLYYEIFSAVQTKKHPRVIRVCATMLGDRRIFSGDMRFCDLAGATLQVVSKEKFGFGPWNQPLAERDQAVHKASRWAQTQGVK